MPSHDDEEPHDKRVMAGTFHLPPQKSAPERKLQSGGGGGGGGREIHDSRST